MNDQSISFAEDGSVPPAKYAELLLRSTSEGMFGLNLEQRCTFMNPAAAAMIGWGQEDVLGKNLHELVHYRRADGSIYSEAECPIADLIRTGQPCRVEGEVFWRRDGSSFDVEYSASPLIEDGAIAGAVICFTDISARKQAEATLQLYRDLFIYNRHGVVIGNADGRTLGPVNPAFARMCGYDGPEQMVGMLLLDLFPPEEHARILQNIQHAHEAGHSQIETTLRRRDGNGVPVLIDLTAVRDPAGHLLYRIVTVFDITDRKRAEEEAARSARRIRTILESITDAFFSVDPQWRFTYVNDEAEQLLRRSRQELLGRVVWEEYPEAVNLSFYREYHRAMETGEPVSFEDFYPPLNLWVEVHAYPSAEGLSVYFQDITARRQNEEALRIARERMTLVLEGADIGLWYSRLPFGRLEWDRRVKEHFWLPPDAEVSIDTFYERLHPEDRERTRRLLDTAIGTHSSYESEHRTVSPVDGREKWIRTIGRPFCDAEGRPVRFDGLTIDVTGAKQADVDREELLASERAARTEAERTSRIKDEFLATLSHELRTPLNAILGWAQILRGSKVQERDLQEGLAVIERNARVQTQLIEDLLDMSRIIAGKVRLDAQHVDLTVAIEAAIDAVAPTAAAKGIRLQKVLDSRTANTVMGDAARLQQIFWNLLTNGIKFTPRHGRVQVFLQRAGSYIEVSVRDTGQGIKPEFLPHLFERFRQADASTTRKQGGLGLGLALVKSLTEMHGGSVHVKSGGEGQGSTFTVRLPLAIIHSDEPENPGSQSASTLAGTDETFAPPPALKKAKIVVIDDEPDARTVVKRMLEECEATVFTAGSATEGLKLVRQVHPDVLVCDIGMPGEDGYQLIRNVRRLGPEAGGDVPAVALTALARSEDRRRAIVAGFDMHVAKPTEAGELIAVVARLAHRIRAPGSGPGRDGPRKPR